MANTFAYAEARGGQLRKVALEAVTAARQAADASGGGEVHALLTGAPGIAARAARASLGFNAASNSTLMASEWHRRTGTRTVVAVTRSAGDPRIFLVSLAILTSSEQSPSSLKEPMWGRRLKAI